MKSLPPPHVFCAIAGTYLLFLRIVVVAALLFLFSFCCSQAAGFVKDYVTRAMLDEVIQAEADDLNADGVISSEEAAAAAKALAASLAGRRAEFQTSAVRLIRAALQGGVAVHALDESDALEHSLPYLTRTLGSAFRAKVRFFGDQCSGAPEGCNARPVVILQKTFVD